MSITSEDLWGGVYDIGTEESASVPAEVDAKLVEFKLSRLAKTRSHASRPTVKKCFTVMESGDGEVPELE